LHSFLGDLIAIFVDLARNLHVPVSIDDLNNAAPIGSRTVYSSIPLDELALELWFSGFELME